MKTTLIFLAVLGLTHASTFILERHAVKNNHVSTKNLDDLFQQFANFIPFDKCVEVVNKYIENDADVKQAYEFLRSDEFLALVTELHSMQEYMDFVAYLNDSGFDYYKYLNIIRGILNLPPINPPSKAIRQVKESGIIMMVEEVLGLLPVDEIREWFLNVCLPDPDFQALILRIQSPEFKNLVDHVYTSQQYKKMTEILIAQGIDVAQIEEAIRDFLNNSMLRKGNIVSFRRSTRGLSSLLTDFVRIVPVHQILEIFLEYAMQDDDVKGVIEYLKSDEFRALVVKIESLQEFKDFLKLIYDYGLNVYQALNIVLDILGLPNVSPEIQPRGVPSTKSGVSDMINKMIALLPLDRLILWYKTTCEPDPEFQDVLAHLRNDDFKVIVNTVMGDPAFQTIRQGLIDLDIDVTRVEKFLQDFFGW